MNITKHAIIRCQQRGISEDIIDLIFQLGKPTSRPGGAIEYKINKKDKLKLQAQLKKLANRLDKAANKAVLVVKDKVITVYHKKGD
ncbi:hypothetical protein [Desulfobacula sp.]|uniref:hypothetical protein n=1 Tax=Desulfobacula sp. TaxID=2593537 RepID=UPI0025C17FBA|nr:hypothetical protein [Desulfobacula sp.]MBC2702951.1 hypothetical protein [Desulfobacula sp.]